MAETEEKIRTRGNFRRELNTIPDAVALVKPGVTKDSREIELLSNFFSVEPMKERLVYKYRIDFEPEIESVSLRSRLFRTATRDVFQGKVNYDKGNDAFSSIKLPESPQTYKVEHPTQQDLTITITVKEVGLLSWDSFEMLRLYNTHMKEFLEKLGFFKVSRAGSFVHPAFVQQIGQNTSIVMVRGYNTSANMFDEGKIFMNLEPVHKLMQKRNILEIMSDIRRQAGNSSFRHLIESELCKKLLVASYNRSHVYRIEGVDFEQNPTSKFMSREKEISYVDYYKQKYNININEKSQPLLRCISNNQRKPADGDEKDNVVMMVPELCNIAGLTQTQLNDRRLKMDLIQASQVSPRDRVSQIRDFIRKLSENSYVNESLKAWGYSYGKDLLHIKGHQLPLEGIGCGPHRTANPGTWPKVSPSADFEPVLKRGATIDGGFKFPLLCLLFPPCVGAEQAAISQKLQQGFSKVGLQPARVERIQMSGNNANHYVQHLNQLPRDTTIAIVVMQRKDSDRYDAIKKLATVNMGLLTQVVTSELLMDPRKADGASFKIALQVAAKIGAEPWRVYIPLSTSMICGYDTYHDTANSRRSFGAFVASMNSTYSRWFSQADEHDRLQELSSQMSQNVSDSLKKYKELNNKYPERVYIYRDGVGEGQLNQVFEIEIKQVKKRISEIDPNIKLTFLIVSKRIGARFFAIRGNDFENPPPGTVISNTVKRQERCDFFLVSQSTRHGTVTPTHYNIVHMDDTFIALENIQQLSYKLCLLYYNWAGSVRVPAPCQYAHKLALLCGEHLHQVPNANLDDKLHFL